MAIRSNSYDGLSLSISQFRKKLQEENAIYKSEDFQDNKGLWQQGVDKWKERQEIAKNIHSQFTDLKSDFEKGTINLVWYKKHLQELNDLLLNSGEKISASELHAGEIATEIKRYL